MVKCSPDTALKAELKDILFDLVDLNSLAVELEYQNHDTKNYRYWIRNSISYVIAVRQILGAREDYKFPHFRYDYATVDELQISTERVLSNYKKILLAYEKEVPELRELLNTIILCLTTTREYAI